jgi:hypothetical protein
MEHLESADCAYADLELLDRFLTLCMRKFQLLPYVLYRFSVQKFEWIEIKNPPKHHADRLNITSCLA